MFLCFTFSTKWFRAIYTSLDGHISTLNTFFVKVESHHQMLTIKLGREILGEVKLSSKEIRELEKRVDFLENYTLSLHDMYRTTREIVDVLIDTMKKFDLYLGDLDKQIDTVELDKEYSREEFNEAILKLQKKLEEQNKG